jgi:hypothetical protein
MPPSSDPRPFPSRSASVLPEKRQALGRALQEMAADLVKERRRTLELERELTRLRTRTDPGTERRAPR